MNRDNRKYRRVFLFPIRRRLMTVTIAWLFGIASSLYVVLPHLLTLPLCALFVSIGILRCRHRQSALLFGVLVMGLLGNFCAGNQLALRDAPCAPQSEISGIVSAIESERRVWLRDVTIAGGESPSRAVIVTLMLAENETAESVQVGQRVSGKGRLFAPDEVTNPGGSDFRIQAICEGYELSGYLLPGWTAEGHAVFSIRESLRRLRAALLAQIEAAFGEHAPLFQALMLGERAEMDAEVMNALRLTGMAHVLSVSGLHLSLIAAALDELLKRLYVKKRRRLAIGIVVLGCYTCLTGASPGTIRALLMALIRSVAVCRGRRYEPLTALSLAALLMTAVCPVLALSGSFQFSFFVVLGMHLMNGRLHARRMRSGRRGRPAGGILRAVMMSAFAQLAAIPMTLRFYGYIPLLALPMNLLFGSIMPFLMLGGWAATALSLLFPKAGGVAASIIALPARGFEGLSMAAASVKGSILRLPAPYAVTLLLVLWLMSLTSERIRFGFGRERAAFYSAILLCVSYAVRFAPVAQYVQIDVGQGDGALLRSGRSCVLVDIGPENTYDMLRYLRFEGLIPEAVILSHLDEDHAGALNNLLRSEIEISGIYLPEGALKEEGVATAVGNAFELVREKEIPVHEVSRGDVIEAGAFRLDVLSPDETLSGSNERSLVLYGEIEGTGLLLTGDLPIDCEREDFPDCDLLKVAHHGSKNATSRTFLNQVTPDVALISVGAGNTYGHPTERVLEDLAAVGARVYRTDLSGCITVWLLDGMRFVQTFLP